MWAAERGHEAVVQLLKDRGDVQAEGSEDDAPESL